MSTQTAEKTSNITLEETSQKQQPQKGYSNWVKIWLGIGLFMIFVQVVVGGITRLTGSGLSITKWEIVTGTLPPLNAAQWQEAFDLYKATPQYEKINQGMSMPEFKFIYFWEYIHRLWARLMGFVFIIPFGVFLSRKMVDRPLLKRLGMVFLLAATVASFGWIMVASGLIERPWVDAYKLTMHLSLAFILYSYLLWTTFKVSIPRSKVFHNDTVKKWMIGLTILTAVQIILGGVMSGTKAGLYFPTWPDMNGVMVPAILMDGSQWNVENLVEYDRGSSAVASIQFVHRSTAYLLFFSALYKARSASLSTSSGPSQLSFSLSLFSFSPDSNSGSLIVNGETSDLSPLDILLFTQSRPFTFDVWLLADGFFLLVFSVFFSVVLLSA